MVRWVGINNHVHINCHDVTVRMIALPPLGNIGHNALICTLPDVDRLALPVLLELPLLNPLRSTDSYMYIHAAIIWELKDTLWSCYDVHNNYAHAYTDRRIVNGKIHVSVQPLVLLIYLHSPWKFPWNTDLSVDLATLQECVCTKWTWNKATCTCTYMYMHA